MTKKLNIKTALFAGLFGLGIFSNELNAEDYTDKKTINVEKPRLSNPKMKLSMDFRNIISNKINERIPAIQGVKKLSAGASGRMEYRQVINLGNISILMNDKKDDDKIYICIDKNNDIKIMDYDSHKVYAKIKLEDLFNKLKELLSDTEFKKFNFDTIIAYNSNSGLHIDFVNSNVKVCWFSDYNNKYQILHKYSLNQNAFNN